jgi:hypothetical protein
MTAPGSCSASERDAGVRAAAASAEGCATGSRGTFPTARDGLDGIDGGVAGVALPGAADGGVSRGAGDAAGGVGGAGSEAVGRTR